MPKVKSGGDAAIKSKRARTDADDKYVKRAKSDKSEKTKSDKSEKTKSGKSEKSDKSDKTDKSEKAKSSKSETVKPAKNKRAKVSFAKDVDVADGESSASTSGDSDTEDSESVSSISNGDVEVNESQSSQDTEDPQDSSQDVDEPEDLSQAEEPRHDDDSPQDEEPEEPVLSHKAKRQARKQAEKNAAAASTAPAPSTDKTKHRYGVWIGNLRFKTTREDLFRWLADRGLDKVERVNMPGTKQGNKGYAYVDFASEAEVAIAVGLSESELDGRNLLIKDASDYSGRPGPTSEADMALRTAASAGGTHSLSKSAKKIMSQQKNPPGETLFVGNLPFDATADLLQGIIDKNEQKQRQWLTPEEKKALPSGSVVRKVRLGTFEDSGKCKGWAFVDFVSTGEATRALINGRNHVLHGRQLKVEYAGADAIRRGKIRPGKQTRRAAASARAPEATRARSGAALADAPRQSASIVPAMGKKLTFD